MRKIKLLLLLGCLLSVYGIENSYGSITYNPVKSGREEALKFLRADKFIKLSVIQFRELTGKKMNLLDKLSFRIAKLKLKHDLKRNPDLLITDYYSSTKRAPTMKVIYWILIGLLTALLLLVLFIGLETKK